MPPLSRKNTPDAKGKDDMVGEQQRETGTALLLPRSSNSFSVRPMKSCMIDQERQPELEKTESSTSCEKSKLNQFAQIEAPQLHDQHLESAVGLSSSPHLQKNSHDSLLSESETDTTCTTVLR